MDRGNVLVIGNSGVGKSTLINAVLGENVAKIGWGTHGTTNKLSIYESTKIPFRIIDTVGFEPSWIKEYQAINAVKKWSRGCAKAGREDNQINVIWFCVDGTSHKLFDKAIYDLSKATSMWKSVPVVVVITKSYSVPERDRNVEMVYKAFAKQGRYSKNLKKVLPVVASTYTINDNAYAPPYGITDLIEVTNDLMPEGVKAAKKDLAEFKLSRKRALAHSLVTAATASGVVISAVSLPATDAAMLSALELGLVNCISQIYGIPKNEQAKVLLNSIVEVGTVSEVARAAISALKAIPGINVGAAVINSVIAGSFVLAIGEGSIYVFEQIYLGNKTVADIDWVKKILESKFSTQLVETMGVAIKKLSNKSTQKEIVDIILSLFLTPKQK